MYAAVLLVALALRMAGLSRPVWLDEASTLQWLRADTWAAWKAALLVDQVPPALPVLLTPWSYVSLDTRWLRLFPVLCGVTTVAVGMWWVSASRAAAIRVGLLLAVSPFLLRYSLELRSYALLGLATVVALAAAWRVSGADDDRPGDRAMLVVALFVACMTHFTAILLVPAAVAAIIVGARDRPLARVPWVSLLLVSLAWAATVQRQGRAVAQLATGWWMPPLDGSLLWRTLAEVAGLVRPGDDVSSAVPLLLGAVVLALCVLFSVAERDRRWMAPLTAGVVYLSGLALTSWLWRSVWWPRTILPGYIALVVAAGLASTCLRGRMWRRSADAGVIVVTLAGAGMWMADTSRQSLEPWLQVSEAVQRAPATDPVFVLPDYAIWPLAEALPPARAARLVSLRMDGRGNARALAETPDAQRGVGTTWLVLRIDLGVRDELAALTPVVDLLRARAMAGASRVHVLLVMSPDVSLVPGLARTGDAVMGLLRTRLGPPSETRTDGRAVSLVFDPSGQPPVQ